MVGGLPTRIEKHIILVASKKNIARGKVSRDNTGR